MEPSISQGVVFSSLTLAVPKPISSCTPMMCFLAIGTLYSQLESPNMLTAISAYAAAQHSAFSQVALGLPQVNMAVKQSSPTLPIYSGYLWDPQI